MSANSLKEKMQEFKDGKLKSVRVSGADLADAAAPEKKTGATQGTVEADVPPEASKDVFHDSHETDTMHQGMTPSFLTEKIDITEADREAFIQAIITGSRYERTFSIFGGKLSGTFRCRSIAESDGIIAWLSHCVNKRAVDARIEYMTMMRNAQLAAQVKSLRGMINEDFEELPQPYAPTRTTVTKPDKNGKDVTTVEVKDPGWLAAAEAWGSRPEALVTAVHNELKKFEKRYWTMVMDAPNQNFWSPAASI